MYIPYFCAGTLNHYITLKRSRFAKTQYVSHYNYTECCMYVYAEHEAVGISPVRSSADRSTNALARRGSLRCGGVASRESKRLEAIACGPSHKAHVDTD